MTTLGTPLIDSDDAPIIVQLPPGLFRFHVFGTWAAQTLTVKTGLDDGNLLDVTDGSFTDDGTLLLYGGCYITVYTAGTYANLTAVVNRADSGVW